MRNPLQLLSNPELLENTRQLAARERELTLAIVEHLREIQRRRAFVDLGYSTLWDYATRGLKYSAGAAKRRIDALHALREHPELKTAVSDGELSLTALSQVQSFVREQKLLPKAERLVLFQSMAGKSTREVEKSLAMLAPERPAPERERPISETQIELRFAVSAELLEMLKRLQGLGAHRLKNPSSYAELLELLAEIGLKELDPAKERRPRRAAPSSACRVGSAPNSRVVRGKGIRSRYVPAAIRREIWRRAGGRCAHRDPTTGQTCASRFALQIEHVIPFAKGGSSDLRNLTLLCRQHNLHRAVQEFGAFAVERRSER